MRKRTKSMFRKVVNLTRLKQRSYESMSEKIRRELKQKIINNKFFKESYEKIYEESDVPDNLKQIDFDNWITGILKKMNVTSYEKGEALCHKGEIGDKMWLVVEGNVGVFIEKQSDTITEDKANFSHIADVIIRNSERNFDLATLKKTLESFPPSLLTPRNIEEIINSIVSNDLDTPENLAIICSICGMSELDNENLYLLLDPHNIKQYFEHCTFLYFYLKKAVRGSGSIVGETSLQSNQPRNATLIAVERTICLTLNKIQFNECLGETIGKQMLKFDFFEECFPSISKRILMNFFYMFDEVKFHRGSCLFAQNQIASRLLLIEKGTVGIYDLNGREIKLAQQELLNLDGRNRIAIVQSSELIGEESLYSTKYHFSAIAITETVQAFSLPRSKFDLAKKIINRQLEELSLKAAEKNDFRNLRKKRISNFNQKHFEPLLTLCQSQLAVIEETRKRANEFTEIKPLEETPRFDLEAISSYKSNFIPFHCKVKKIDDIKMKLIGVKLQKNTVMDLMYDCLLGIKKNYHKGTRAELRKQRIKETAKEIKKTQNEKHIKTVHSKPVVLEEESKYHDFTKMLRVKSAILGIDKNKYSPMSKKISVGELIYGKDCNLPTGTHTTGFILSPKQPTHNNLTRLSPRINTFRSEERSLGGYIDDMVSKTYSRSRIAHRPKSVHIRKATNIHVNSSRSRPIVKRAMKSAKDVKSSRFKYIYENPIFLKTFQIRTKENETHDDGLH